MARKYFVRTYVADEYQNLGEGIGSIENLKKRLLEEDHISCAYQLNNGYCDGQTNGTKAGNFC